MQMEMYLFNVANISCKCLPENSVYILYIYIYIWYREKIYELSGLFFEKGEEMCCFKELCGVFAAVPCYTPIPVLVCAEALLSPNLGLSLALIFQLWLRRKNGAWGGSSAQLTWAELCRAVSALG